MTEQGPQASDPNRDGDPLDAALALLHGTDVEYSSARIDGLSNHGPMAAVSLAELGRPDRIAPFVAAYLPRLRPLPPASGAPRRLGDPASSRAWIDFFEARLEGADWRAVLGEQLDVLLPGVVAAACHGWLRTAHAVQGLLARDTAVRRRELAFGLASWAARHQVLPGAPGASPERGLDVVRALERVPLAPEMGGLAGGLILDRVRAVDTLPGFAEVIEAVDLDALPFAEAVGSLAAAAARLFVVTPSQRFVYLHAVTATSALRLVEGVLDEDARRRALGAAFQAVAALHASHGDESATREAFGATAAYPSAPAEAIRARGAASDDDHDVKLAAAALREHARSGRPELLAAATSRLRLRPA